MAIREDIVASAISFLQDPNVVSSPIENKLSFLRSKNLTQEEIDAAFARAGSTSAGPVTAPIPQQQQQQPYYGQYPQQPYGWQSAPPEPPRRDWRDWFIMATVMGGVGYGLYFITKRYIYPLVSPPTPEKLEQDKATVDENFEKAFATLDQLVQDTAVLKESEKERSEKLNKVLDELEAFMRDTRSAERRHDDETERLRDEMKTLKGALPKAIAANKDHADGRLKEITTEIKSLKSLISQRMNSAPPPSPAPTSNHLRPTSGNAVPASPAASAASPGVGADAKKDTKDENASPSQTSKQDYISSLGGRSSPFGSGMPATKASIPAWQLAASKSSDAGSSSQQEAGSSS
jgi:peroxin-14